MRKILVFCAVAILCCILSLSCARSRAYVESESPEASLFGKYRKVHVDWLDLKEEDWKVHRYESIQEWRKVIYEMNVDAFHKYLKKMIPDKEFSFATSISDEPGKDVELRIGFSEYNIVNYRPVPGRSFGRGWIELPIKIHYIDLKTNKEVYTESVTAIGYNKAFTMNFENRLNPAMYSLAEYIAERIAE